MNPLPMPTLKMSKTDSDNNGKIDEFRISMNFKQDPTKVRQIQVYSTFDYFVQTKIKMQLVGLVHLKVETPLGASKVVSDGILALQQNKPVLIDSITRSLYDQDPLLDSNFEQFSMEQILENYNHRTGKSTFKLTIIHRAPRL